ncbi:hypothetical protein B0H13DRAFT_1889892 [Mycena leptocephala]|nr:hypothetical protein B0H13DRAFT_1889892 [Mycena leptocephala]
MRMYFLGADPSYPAREYPALLLSARKEKNGLAFPRTVSVPDTVRFRETSSAVVLMEALPIHDMETFIGADACTFAAVVFGVTLTLRGNSGRHQLCAFSAGVNGHVVCRAFAFFASFGCGANGVRCGEALFYLDRGCARDLSAGATSHYFAPRELCAGELCGISELQGVAAGRCTQTCVAVGLVCQEEGAFTTRRSPSLLASGYKQLNVESSYSRVPYLLNGHRHPRPVQLLRAPLALKLLLGPMLLHTAAYAVPGRRCVPFMLSRQIAFLVKGL